MFSLFYEYISKQNCLLYDEYGYECRGKTHSHHIVSRGAGGKEINNLIPLCASHHVMGANSIHFLGKKTFEKKYKINLKEEGVKYFDQYMRKA